jgi:GH24 family phage-related lysozyme (muramidase)|tara:strand:- start:223 stop:660 length:438 start_codon:yes stop_codon:yes gene_type:complete
MADYTELKTKIKKHEGYRDHIYLDSLSIRTFGYGHMVLDTDDLTEGVNYPIEIAEEYFEKDFNISLSEAEKLIGDIELNNTQKCCIIQMVYQLGGPRTSKFKKMWKALEEGDALTASAEILDSRWHAQTPGRCEEVAEEMAGSTL